MITNRKNLRARLIACILTAILCKGGALAAAPEEPGPQLIGRGAEALVKVDTDFARMAGLQGAAKAFETYLTPDCINPSANAELPLDRATTIERLKKVDDKGWVLNWKPSRAEIADSGEIGFTYGKWTIAAKAGGDALAHGFYTTVWRKQVDGTWKATFDMGNEAPAEKSK